MPHNPKPNHISKSLAALGAALWVLVATYQPANACACCSEAGERSEYDVPLIGPNTYLQQELDRIQTAGTAHLYLTACGYECVTGIEAPQDSFDITLTHANTRWLLQFSKNNTPLGQLTFQIPQTAHSFNVDLTPTAPTTSVTLYKEMTLNGQLIGTGIFTGLATATPATLILQGIGNSCTMAEDFTHWQLGVQSPSATFKFFGALALPQ